jgi:hypothetical protein
LQCLSCGGCCGLHEWAKGRLGLDPDANEAEGDEDREDEGDKTIAVKDGLTDVAIRANDFMPGCEKASMLLDHSNKIVRSFYRNLSSTTLCILGVGVTSSVSAFVVFCIVSLEPSDPDKFGYIAGYSNPTSSFYIANPLLVVALSWILSAYIAYGFMATWSHTADALLFCYMWNRKYARKTVDRFIPETVRCIVGFDYQDNDRYPYYGRADGRMYLQTWLPYSAPNHKQEHANRSSLPPRATWNNQQSTGWMGSMGL